MDRERRAKRREGEQSGLLLTLGETKHHLEGVEKQSGGDGGDGGVRSQAGCLVEFMTGCKP